MKFKQRIINYLLKHLLNAIVLEDVVTENTAKQLMIGGIVQKPDEVKALKAEAKMILDTRVWSLLENTLKAQAQNKIFIKSLNFSDTAAGKLMLYNLDVQKKILYLLIK